ncbi:anhydro-N-acetylmuramic acid kinase [Sphingobacterium thalpophilum]|uniref:Anhydro-N-acetylmuramic acid kinase n=1 Tax=Sphingobacterium thalpophilum TaxID=259 RepID=A0A4U9V035_9SPHI|nr:MULTISPECIES: anhydro-N-acetylmuramic acid kinase [Sphingobacterium]MCW8311043.1 anhydro-N-acetylmuramic acid kinase [Sphingobacterium sp. InxBP1]VTR35954.1 Anhydro-N-acetylmuramic acid kinase [Sphingobacterium thalpophilum]
MNPQITKLYEIAKKKERRIIGLMSGTSLDGLDIALCRIENAGKKSKISLEKFITMDYEEDFRSKVREIFAKRIIDQQVFSGLNAYVGIVHARLINQALQAWGISAAEIDCIASHGQTVYHAPQSLTKDLGWPNSTLQIGDGDHIAVDTGIITLSDFRQKHIAAGGEGAPLAAYGDYLLFSHPTENRFLLNIGGISNFTFIPNQYSELKAYATDLGPGNTLMNQFMKAHFGVEMDKDATTAKKGSVHNGLLEQLLSEEFLSLDFPKTTGPELFNLSYLRKAQQKSGTLELSAQNVMATLNRFSAQAIVNAIQKQSAGLDNVAVYISGGGLHNPLLVDHIKGKLGKIAVLSFDALGIDPDAKEALLFALLANETLAGNRSHVANIKDSPAICMGKISLPQ